MHFEELFDDVGVQWGVVERGLRGLETMKYFGGDGAVKANRLWWFLCPLDAWQIRVSPRFVLL